MAQTDIEALEETCNAYASKIKELESRLGKKATDEEINHIACEMSQQDWSDLRFKEVYRKAFIAGAKYFSA